MHDESPRNSRTFCYTKEGWGKLLPISLIDNVNAATLKDFYFIIAIHNLFRSGAIHSGDIDKTIDNSEIIIKDSQIIDAKIIMNILHSAVRRQF